MHQPGPDGTEPLRQPGAHAPPAELDYELIRLIGQGGYGDVWLLRDRAENYFACKVVYRESFQHDRPYEREYEGIQKFEPVSRSSENQVRILHVGRRDDAGYFYYIMELADDVHSGETIDPAAYTPRTLKSEIELRKNIPVAECVQIGLALCDALENLHNHGLIHRDIKPANIIFVKGVPRLADIGLVTDRDITVSYVGTEGFIPPEGPKSAQADIYSLGKVLYEMVTGKDRMQFPELPENFSELPDWEALLELNAIIIKACETNPKKRYASAKDFYDDLNSLAAGKSVRKISRQRRRLRFLSRIGLILASAAIITATAIHFWKSRGDHGNGNATNPITSKIPWPAAHDIAENEAKLKDTYGTQLSSGSFQVRQKAALEVLDHSSTTGDPAFEAASLRVAGMLAAEAEDFSLVAKISDAMGQRFEINVLPQKAELLQAASEHARTPGNKNDLTDACLGAGFAAIAADDYASATRLAALAANSAAGANDPSMAPQALFLKDQTIRCRTAYESISTDWAIFREKTTDPKANLAVGKFLCFVKNDWPDGLPLLARGSDSNLKSVASIEINGKLQDAQNQVALADAWWNLSGTAPGEDKSFYQRRARYWYLKSITSSPAANQAALRQKLAERINIVPTDSATVHIVSNVGGTEFVDIYSDEVQWKNSRRETTGNKINYLNLGDFKSGDLEIIKNSGATWLMPDTVDFSTAQLVKSRRQGQATLQIADDHVRVVLAHSRMGNTEIDVTVTFAKKP
jgi:serine/threonine protein kinase